MIPVSRIFILVEANRLLLAGTICKRSEQIGNLLATECSNAISKPAMQVGVDAVGNVLKEF